MRIIRDYTCDWCGATIEAIADNTFSIADDWFPHMVGKRRCGIYYAQLSPTATTFTHADRSAHKRARS